LIIEQKGDIMDIVILIIASISTVLSLIILIKLFSEKKEDNTYKYFDSLTTKINGLEHKQLKAMLENNLMIVEKLEKISNRMNKDFISFQEGTSRNINESNIKLSESLSINFNILTKRIDENLNNINNRVDQRLNDGFDKTNKTFANILERLTKIDEAQKKIDSLSTNIVSLQDILTDKKSRGTFGEVQLNNILISIFGEANDKIYQIQKKLSNNNIADAVIYTPEPVGTLCIDSKFPLENYQRMIDKNISEFDRMQAEKEFKVNIKKHINDISDKYIITGETSEQAIMFIPAEAIFAEINAYHQDLIDYASMRKVRLASPTTLMYVLSIVQIILKNVEREKFSSIIHSELNKLGDEFKRYKTRWDALAKDIKKVTDDVENINITSNKIEKKFSSISRVELDNKDIDFIDDIGEIEEIV
jgi:DNA recombination protein RmuC